MSSGGVFPNSRAMCILRPAEITPEPPVSDFAESVALLPCAARTRMGDSEPSVRLDASSKSSLAASIRTLAPDQGAGFL
jgi:hypothetical protein